MVSTSKQPAILDYQNIIFDSSSIKFNSTNGTYDHTFLPYLVVPLFYLLTFDGSNVTLSSTNITYDCIYITFSGSLIIIFLLTFDDFIFTLTVLTLHMTILMLHLVVPLFFFTHI